jgi:hypothetical protein
MSETSSEPKGKPARPVNRWGIGTLSVIQLVLIAILLIALNYLASQYFSRVDLSRSSMYSLSPATKGYLKDEALKSRSTPVKWIMAFRRSSPFYERVRALAEEYERLSDGKISLEVVDPMRSPDRAEQIAETYGISLIRDLLIFDARTDESAVTIQNTAGTKTLNPNVKLVVADEMVLYHTDQKGQRRPTGFRGEDVMTARLVESIEGKPRKIGFLADKSRINSEGPNSPWSTLETTLRYQNIELTPINLSGLQSIPSDLEGLALVAPRYDLTDEEIAVLDSYWKRSRASLLVILGAYDTPPKLRAFLRGYGVTPRRDRIVTRDGERTISTVRGTFTYGIDFLSDLSGQATIFEGASSSLEVREGAGDLINRKIFPTGLILAGDGFWGETQFGEGQETFDPQEDTAPPLYLAASIVRGAMASDEYAAETSRMVIVSNSDFLDPANQRAENLDFLASSVNWLVGRESLAGVGPRSLGTYKLPILQAQVSFINRVNLIFFPGFLAILGGFIWSSRRA